jgi:hypothetical protein
MLVLAGRLQAGGRLEEARRRARRGGFVAVAGACLLAPLVVAATAERSLETLLRAGVPSGGLVLAAGATALLAGLAGKPRPSGAVAFGLWLAGLAWLSIAG